MPIVVCLLLILLILFAREYGRLALRRWPAMREVFRAEGEPPPVEERSSDSLRTAILEIMPPPPARLTREEVRDCLQSRLGVPVPRQRLYAELNEMVRNDRTLSISRSPNGTTNPRHMHRRYQQRTHAPR